MLARRRIAQIEQITLLLHDALAVTLEERGLRKLLGHRRLYADHLRLQPDARDHAGVLDGVDDLDDALLAREAGLGRHPLADGRPPVAGVVVPAAVDDEDLDAGLARGLDQRQLLLGGRIAVDGVHVIVEHDARLGVVDVRRTHLAAVVGDVGDHAVEIMGDGEGGRHGGEGFAQMQFLEPSVVLVGRAGQRHAAVLGVVLHVPAPGAVVFDLEQPGQLHFLGLENGQRNLRARGPRAGGNDLMALTRIDLGELRTDVRQQVTHRTAAPTAFGEPVETAFEQVPTLKLRLGALRGVRRDAERAAPADDGIEQHRFKTHVGDGHVGLHHRRALVDAVSDGRLDVAILVLQHDAQFAATSGGAGLVAAVAQLAADDGVRELVAGDHMTGVGGHDFRDRRAFREAHGDAVDGKVTHDDRLVIRVFERHGHRARVPREVLGHRYLHNPLVRDSAYALEEGKATAGIVCFQT